jgi:hypothetical protein
MLLNALTLALEEKLSDAFALPTRHLQLRVELPSAYPWTGRDKNAPPESVAVAVEVSINGAAYVEQLRVGPFAVPGVWTVDMPRADASEDAADFIQSGRRRSVARVRVVHIGRHEPRVRLAVLGL